MNLMEKMSSVNRAFLAPELIIANDGLKATAKADIYTVGAILYFLISKGIPESKSFHHYEGSS